METAGSTPEGYRTTALKATAPAGRRLSLLGGCAVAMALWLPFSPPVRAADLSWSNPGSGNWTDIANWDTGTVPTGSDNVNIDTGGTVTVDSAGQTADFMSVGSFTGGSLAIQGNGSLNAAYMLFGEGTITVTGPQASFDVRNDLVLGRVDAGFTGSGLASMTVSGGAHVTAGRTFIGEEPSPFAANTGINVTVTGPGTRWDIGAGGLFVGGVTGNPATTLRIENGAEMTSAGGSEIGYGAAAEVTVTGAGSKLSFDVDLHLGVSRDPGLNALGGDGNGTLTIDDGGEVDASTVVFGYDGTGASGTLNLNGSPGAQGLLQTGLLIKDVGTGTVSFDGGILRVSRDAGLGGIFITGFDPGDLIIDAGNLFLDSNGFNIIADSGFSGVGGLIKQGAGTLFLTSDNTYTGGTTVESGTLSIGDGGTTGSVVGDIQVDAPGILAFNRSDDITYADILSGPGAMIKQGKGTLILEGNSTAYTGSTTVAAGTLVVGDSSTPTAAIAGTATVDNGATLAGFGTVGSLVNNGRVMAGDPSGSLGVLSATGNYVQGAGGDLITYVTQPAASRVDVAGAASLAGRAVFTYAAGAYTPGIYPILTSGGGVSGAFSLMAESGAIPLNLVRRVTYSTGVVNLVLSLPATTDTGNETAIFPDASGTAQRNTQLATSYLLDDAAATCAVSDKTCFWLNPLGHFANFSGSNDTPSFSSDTGGLMAGAHRLVSDNMLVGIGGGYEYTVIAAGSSTASIETARVFAYGNVDLAPVVISGALGYAHDWFDTTRNNADGILGGDGAKQSHQASEYSAGIQAAMPVRIGPVELRPKAGLQYAFIDEDSFDEDGAEPLNLHGDKNRHSSLRSFIGLGLSQQIVIDRLTLAPNLNLGYARELLSENQATSLSLNDHADFQPGNPVASRNIVTAGAGIDLISLDGVNIGANYGASIYVGDGIDHTVRLRGEWIF